MMSQKCPTMSPQQESTASSISYLNLGIKEFTKVMESPSRPGRRLNCFETTPIKNPSNESVMQVNFSNWFQFCHQITLLITTLQTISFPLVVRCLSGQQMIFVSVAWSVSLGPDFWKLRTNCVVVS